MPTARRQPQAQGQGNNFGDPRQAEIGMSVDHHILLCGETFQHKKCNHHSDQLCLLAKTSFV